MVYWPDMKFQDLCHPHRAELLVFARRFTGQDHTAEDLVQEAMIKAFLFWDQFNQDTTNVQRDVRVWLRRILSNTFYTQYGKDVKRSNAMGDYRETLEVGGQFAEESPEYIEAVQAAVNKLKPMYREVIDLHYTEGLTYRGIAERLGITFSKAQKRLWRARQFVKESLLQAGFVEPPPVRTRKVSADLVDASTFESTQSEQAETYSVYRIMRRDDSASFDDGESTPDSLAAW